MQHHVLRTKKIKSAATRNMEKSDGEARAACESDTGPTLTSELHRLRSRAVAVCCAAACTAAVLLARCCSPGQQACLPNDPAGPPCLLWHTALLGGCGWVWGRGTQLMCGCASQEMVASAVLAPWVLWGLGFAETARVPNTVAAETPPDGECCCARCVRGEGCCLGQGLCLSQGQCDGGGCCCCCCLGGGALALFGVLLSTSLLLALLVVQARHARGRVEGQMTLSGHRLYRVDEDKWLGGDDPKALHDGCARRYEVSDEPPEARLCLDQQQWVLHHKKNDGSDVLLRRWPSHRGGVKVRAHELPMMFC